MLTCPPMVIKDVPIFLIIIAPLVQVGLQNLKIKMNGSTHYNYYILNNVFFFFFQNFDVLSLVIIPTNIYHNW
jgi:hypothetical protein